MCGRYFVIPSDPEIRAIMEEMNRSRLAEQIRVERGLPIATEGEVFPSAVVPAVAVSRAGNRRVFPMKWGFSGSGKKLIINARTETAAEKPMFREAWAGHRCAVPASWYFEWDHPQGAGKPGNKYAIRPEGEGIVWLAGLYRVAQGLPEFVILTRPASASLAWMHDRMPLMLPESSVTDWIRPGSDPAALAGQALSSVRWALAV